jgi:hypothetical protein
MLVIGLFAGLVATTGSASAAATPVHPGGHRCPKAEADAYCGDRPQKVRYPDGYQPKTGIDHYLPSFGD